MGSHESTHPLPCFFPSPNRCPSPDHLGAHPGQAFYGPAGIIPAHPQLDKPGVRAG